MQIENTKKLKESIRRGAYVWPGGYPIFYVTQDAACICPKCCKTEFRLIASAIKNQDDKQWQIVGADINYENTSLYCDHCNAKIESAYGDDNARGLL